MHGAGSASVDGAGHLFVFGAAHSGTTIAYRMLAYHPDLGWPSQFSLRGGEIPGRRRLPGAARLDVVLRRLPHRWTKRGETALRRFVVPRPVEARTLWQHLLDDDATDAERVRGALDALSRRLGGRPLLVKLPEFDRHLGLLREAAPGARFLHMVRDGRAVAFSLQPKYERSLPAAAALTAAAEHWVEVTARATGAAGIELVELRYEDFCADVHGSLRNVLERSGLDPGRFPFERCPARLDVSNYRWIEAAGGADLERIAAVQAEPLRRYGYPADPRRSEVAG